MSSTGRKFGPIQNNQSNQNYLNDFDHLEQSQSNLPEPLSPLSDNQIQEPDTQRQFLNSLKNENIQLDELNVVGSVKNSTVNNSPTQIRKNQPQANNYNETQSYFKSQEGGSIMHNSQKSIMQSINQGEINEQRIDLINKRVQEAIQNKNIKLKPKKDLSFLQKLNEQQEYILGDIACKSYYLTNNLQNLKNKEHQKQVLSIFLEKIGKKKGFQDILKKFIILPYEVKSFIWDIFYAIVLVNVIFFESIKIFFIVRNPEDIPTNYEYVKDVLLALLFFDIFKNFMTGYYDKGVLIQTPKKIAIGYLKGYFALDLLSFLGLYFSTRDTNSNWYLLPKDVIDQFRSLGKFMILLKCKFQYEQEGEQFESWISFQNLLDKNLKEQYIHSYYWATGMMVSEIIYEPQTNFEILFTVFTLYIACFIIAFVINVVGEIIQLLQKQQEDFKMDLQIINKYMYKKKINTTLQFQIRNYIENLYYVEQRTTSRQEKKVLSKLSPQLQTQLEKSVNQEIVKNLGIFQEHFSDKLIDELPFIMKEQVLKSHELVISNDVITDDIFYVQEGHLEVIFQGKKQMDQNKVLGLIPPNTVFNSYTFFTGQQESKYFIQSKNIATIFRINLQALIDILEPEDKERKERIRHEFLFNLGYKDSKVIKYTECIICKQTNHLVQDCNFTTYRMDKDLQYLKMVQNVNQQFRDSDFERRNFMKTKSNRKERQFYFVQTEELNIIEQENQTGKNPNIILQSKQFNEFQWQRQIVHNEFIQRLNEENESPSKQIIHSRFGMRGITNEIEESDEDEEDSAFYEEDEDDLEYDTNYQDDTSMGNTNMQFKKLLDEQKKAQAGNKNNNKFIIEATEAEENEEEEEEKDEDGRWVDDASIQIYPTLRNIDSKNKNKNIKINNNNINKSTLKKSQFQKTQSAASISQNQNKRKNDKRLTLAVSRKNDQQFAIPTQNSIYAGKSILNSSIQKSQLRQQSKKFTKNINKSLERSSSIKHCLTKSGTLKGDLGFDKQISMQYDVNSPVNSNNSEKKHNQKTKVDFQIDEIQNKKKSNSINQKSTYNTLSINSNQLSINNEKHNINGQQEKSIFLYNQVTQNQKRPPSPNLKLNQIQKSQIPSIQASNNYQHLFSANQQFEKSQFPSTFAGIQQEKSTFFQNVKSSSVSKEQNSTDKSKLDNNNEKSINLEEIWDKKVQDQHEFDNQFERVKDFLYFFPDFNLTYIIKKRQFIKSKGLINPKLQSTLQDRQRTNRQLSQFKQSLAGTQVSHRGSSLQQRMSLLKNNSQNE